ncbi:hypothetical protein RM530_12745 [Algiphilus sp. W345]|uniref:Uncharacterized protein n=1 Tax=Banduia mediterranea TaxID=3075609 RepID=A0ABU2WK26_9GAMM|nr:hypothetical protein [Algiphilus sp. W345]MDT0498227.1 hypothetical protein [Algiphilus sp. W345]
MADAPLAAAAESWREAAARLAEGLHQSPDDETRLAVLKRVCRRFGYLGYPGFLKLMLIVADSDNTPAKRDLAAALALALKRHDLPTGQLTSWGTTDLWKASGDNTRAISASVLNGQHLGVAPRRSFGPLEYLTVWYCQRTQRPYLSDSGYHDAVVKLVGLLNNSDDARGLYPIKIETDLATEPEGAYTRQTRSRLGTLASAWKRGDGPLQVADQLIGKPKAGSDTHRDWILLNL